MKTVMICKMPFETKHFNSNQKVWLVATSGQMKAQVCGKHNGSG